MLSPRSNYITLLKSKRDTSIDKTRQVYMSKYNYNSQNKKIRDKTHREQRYSRNCFQKLVDKSRNSLNKIQSTTHRSGTKTHQRRLSKQKSNLDLMNHSKQKIDEQKREEQSRKNKEGENCRLVLKSNGIQKDYFLQVDQITMVRKFLFRCCPSARNFITLPRQISLQYMLTQENISGSFLNGQSLYFKPEFDQFENKKASKQNWDKQITLQNFQIIKQVGAGGFSKVYLCRSKLDNNFYAMKLIQKQMVIKNQKKGIIMNQRNIMAQAKHSFIINMKYAFQSEKYIVFVLQYCPGGQLFGLIKKFGRLSQDVAKFYIIQILLGLSYLHSLKVVYRDIKPQNILLDIDGHVKIADLGLAKPDMQSGKLAHSFCGSPEYMSPQMILQVGHTYPVDFYCLGALLYELLTGLPPFYSQDPNQIYQAVLQQQVSFPSEIDLTNQCKSLIRSLLFKDPKQRLGSLYGSKQVLAHPWFGKQNYELFTSKKIKPPFAFNSLQKINLDGNTNPKYIDNYQKVLKDQKNQMKDFKNIMKNFYYNQIPQQFKKIPFLALKNQFTQKSQTSLKGRQTQRKNNRKLSRQNSPPERQSSKRQKKRNLNGLSLQFSLQNFFKK